MRFLTTPDEGAARRALWTNALLTIPASLLFFGIGTALFVFYRAHPAAQNPAAPADQIFPWFIANELPVGVAGLVVAGIFAAAMSSLDSSMHSISTSAVTDLYRRFRPDASDRRCLSERYWCRTYRLLFTFPVVVQNLSIPARSSCSSRLRCISRKDLAGPKPSMMTGTPTSGSEG